MNKQTKTNSLPKIQNKGHGPHKEKPKDFKKSLTKLFNNLGRFKILIVISLILAALGSILSLVAPNKLSDLTDEIQKGLVINSKNLNIINEDIKKEFTKENLENKFKDILGKDLNNDTIYNSILISKEDKEQLLQLMNNQKVDKFSPDILEKMPKSISKVLFKSKVIDGVTITSEDKIIFIIKMSNITTKSTANEIYKKIDELPKSIQTVIEPKMNMNIIKNITKFLIILYVLSAVFSFLQSILMTEVANKFAKKLRSNISKKINKLPLKYFDKNLAGDILSRVTNDVDTIAQSMNQSLATLVTSVTLFIGSITMMFYTNWILAITAILSSLLGFVFMFKILSKSQKYFEARQIELGKLNGHIEEIYSGLNVVKVYNGKKDSDKKFDELNKSVYECNRKSQFLSGLMHPMMGFIGNFGYVMVCIVGAILTSKDIITFGVIVAFIMYVRLFTNPLSQIAQAMTSLQSTAAASERVFEFLEEKEMEEENPTIKLDRENVKGEITFTNVKFGYDENLIIKDFNAKIKPGQKIAIVGPTGAGKTTMVNLLMKFYNINDGDIKIDGISIKELSRENIHDLFTMVLQDTWVFNGTVKENVIYNKENVKDEDVIKVCKEVGIHHFIKTLPKGYDSYLTDSESISSGQRQLLTIARGMIDNAPLLILDEATSNVDTRTEELVQKAMDKLSEGKTSFIIAHRLSTIKNADLILVMKDGNIIEQGNHNDLMNQNGFYSNLYNSQFEKVS